MSKEAMKLAERPAQQQPVVWMYQDKSTHQVSFQKHMRAFVDHGVTYETPLYTTPPARKPLTHEQRVDLLAKFEPHKHEWHAPAILIDMVEAAHNIKETP